MNHVIMLLHYALVYSLIFSANVVDRLVFALIICSYVSVVVMCNPVPMRDSSRPTSKHNGDEYHMLFM